jgi:hypothetical protein
VGRVDHTRVRLNPPLMCRDQCRAVKNPHHLLVEDDLDVIAHESMRHAVAHRVDIPQGIVGHAPTEPLLASWQRADR